MTQKTIVLLMVSAVCFGLLGIPTASTADCPDYGIVCNNSTCHGWYGTCWSWRHGCVPCSDHSGVCSNSGPKCIWFKSAVADVVIAIICKYVHIPLDKCVVCDKVPCSFSATEP